MSAPEQSGGEVTENIIARIQLPIAMDVGVAVLKAIDDVGRERGSRLFFRNGCGCWEIIEVKPEPQIAAEEP